MGEARCPLCTNTEARLVEEGPERQFEKWHCAYCGAFELEIPFTHRSSLEDEDPHLLSGLTAERNLRDQPPLVIGPHNVDDLVARGPKHPVEQADRLLVNLAYKSSEPGVWTSLTSRGHRALAFAKATDAFMAWLDFLESEELIEYTGEREDEPNDLGFRLTLDGWRRVRELRTQGADSDIGFVAMDFGKDFEDLWTEGIEPGIEAAGWTPARVDREEHAERIDDRILNRIDEAAFVVADTTGNNPGACFEAGYALGQGTPVIWTARQDTVSSDGGKGGLHFDIRQYNHLTWEAGHESDLVEPLSERIRALMGERTPEERQRSPFVE